MQNGLPRLHCTTTMMPPNKPTKSASGSPSNVLVPVGPRHIVPKTPKLPGKRQLQEKPTTSRALVLRNGKYGTQGTGEVMLMSKMSGREKMDLLAGMFFAHIYPLKVSILHRRESC